MNRKKLQEIAKLRRKEAVALLKSNHYAGAYYLLGYAVECALKACIAKKTRKYDFPNKEIANKAYVHNLEQLLKLAELDRDLVQDMRINNTLAINWAVVKDWTESSRYSVNISSSDAKDLYSACTSRANGILSWIKLKW